MSKKTKEIKENNKWKMKNRLILEIVGIVSIFFIFMLWASLARFIEWMEFDLLNVSIWDAASLISDDNTSTGSTKNNENEIKEEKINVLLVWRWWWNHDAPNLTDTMILWSLNLKDKTISMLSIPRDLYVEFPEKWWRWKINQIYSAFLWKGEDYAMDKLKEKITDITWEKIDYYANVDFKWFTDIIDILWWVEITVPKTFIDRQYPLGNWYTTFMLKKWTWTLDWEVALKYIRSRHSTSDFDRSLRQQQVLAAIKKQLKELGYFKDIWKIKDLFLSLNKNVKTDIEITTMLKIWKFMKQNEVSMVPSFNLNNSCMYWENNSCLKWWFLYVPQQELFDNMSVLLVEWSNKYNLNNYEVLNKYAYNIFNNPKAFLENYEINIFNASKVWWIAWSLAGKLRRYWFNVPMNNALWNVKDTEYEKSRIYYNWISEDSVTIKVLEEFLGIESKKMDAPVYSENEGVKIEIVLWDDYKEVLDK